MSAQFGKCNFNHRPIGRQEFDKVRSLVAGFGPDGESCICQKNFGVLYRAFYTTRESRHEKQPHIAPSGWILTWDGRLDNREELIGQFAPEFSREPCDLEIVASAYDRWGTDAFAKLIGDWALSIWDSRNQTLVLAKDFVGTRHLYYLIENNEVTWSTVLDPLVLCAEHTWKLEEEYIAGWLAFFPATHLTPYVGIHAVRPSSFVRITKNGRTTSKYWDFDPGKQIRYSTDSDYEEHFRAVFSQSVRRRLRSNSPVLAELSGGMDSSSIVCVADDLIAQDLAAAPRLDTLSYYDSSEPGWDEHPYFAEVEKRRKRAGCHVPIDSCGALTFASANNRPALIPSAISNVVDQQFAKHISSNEYRVVLSGLAGDEVTGGVPTPIPELSDLLVSGALRDLAHQLQRWALEKRRPWFYLLAETLESFVPRTLLRVPNYRRPADWLRPAFVARNRAALAGYERRLTLFGPLPSFQGNITALNALRRQLACSAISAEGLHEPRYPYLDRDLLAFLYAVPREQLVRPGCRRSLLRRALHNIVPAAILDRRRKAFVSRGPLIALAALSCACDGTGSVGDSVGIVDAQELAEVLRQASHGTEIPVVTVVRTMLFESWLKCVLELGILNCIRVGTAGASSVPEGNLPNKDLDRPQVQLAEAEIRQERR